MALYDTHLAFPGWPFRDAISQKNMSATTKDKTRLRVAGDENTNSQHVTLNHYILDFFSIKMSSLNRNSNNFTLGAMNRNFHPSFVNDVKRRSNTISQVVLLLHLLVLLLLFIRENLWTVTAKQQPTDLPRLLPDSFIFQPITTCQTESD